MKLIKRYKNRRLYDTEDKRYITHAQLIAIIDSDVPFKVVDSVTVMSRLACSHVRDW